MPHLNPKVLSVLFDDIKSEYEKESRRNSVAPVSVKSPGRFYGFGDKATKNSLMQVIVDRINRNGSRKENAPKYKINEGRMIDTEYGISPQHLYKMMLRVKKGDVNCSYKMLNVYMKFLGYDSFDDFIDYRRGDIGEIDYKKQLNLLGKGKKSRESLDNFVQQLAGDYWCIHPKTGGIDVTKLSFDGTASFTYTKDGSSFLPGEIRSVYHDSIFMEVRTSQDEPDYYFILYTEVKNKADKICRMSGICAYLHGGTKNPAASKVLVYHPKILKKTSQLLKVGRVDYYDDVFYQLDENIDNGMYYLMNKHNVVLVNKKKVNAKELFDDDHIDVIKLYFNTIRYYITVNRLGKAETYLEKALYNGLAMTDYLNDIKVLLSEKLEGSEEGANPHDIEVIKDMLKLIGKLQ